MPLPVDYGTGTVTGTFTDTNGDPVVGTISFTPSASRLLGTGAVILGDPVVVPLDDAGSLTVILPASDDPNVSPTDFTYRVDETFVGTVGSTYFIDVLEGVTLDLADVLVPGTVNNGTVIWAAQLPSQTGNAGKLLRTDGTDLSWAGLGSVIADASAKVTPVGADEFVMSDSAAAGVAKRISFTDLSAAIGGGVPDTTGANAEDLLMVEIPGESPVWSGAFGAVLGDMGTVVALVGDTTDADPGDVLTVGTPGTLPAYAPPGVYTPADAAVWDGSPTTLAEAIDRLAAVVGDTTPIP